MVATLASQPASDLLAGLNGRADILEVRVDLVGDLDIDYLRSHFEGQLLYTLRSRAEGGLFEGDEAERHRRLGEAGTHYDLLDLEGARDANWPGLSSVEPQRRIVSWHGETSGLTGLRERLAAMREIDSRWWKLIPLAQDFATAKLPLALLEGDHSGRVIAFAGGAVGGWTRLLAPRVGAPVVYAAATETPGAVGQPTLDRLTEDYGLPNLPPVRQLFALVGDPVEQSLSPRLHNGLYRELGYEALYLAFQVDEFGPFWLEMVEGGILERFGMPLTGLSVTMPHKEIALAVAGASSPLAARIGAANTLIHRKGVWEAETTDPEGITRALRHRGVDLDGRLALVVGVGGAGRSAAVGLDQAGATVELANRTAERGQIAASRLEMSCVDLDGVDLSRYEVLVNATPLGRERQEPLPFDLDSVRQEALVIDLNYSHRQTTALVDAALERDLAVIEGREILLGQGAPQFRMMTGLEMPMTAARRLLS